MINEISPVVLWSLFSGAVLLWLFDYVRTVKVKVPMKGKKFWEPRIVANFRFFVNGRNVIGEGYDKV